MEGRKICPGRREALYGHLSGSSSGTTGDVTGIVTANMTVSPDPSVIALAKSQAAQHGMAASAWVARLIRQAAVAESARRYDESEQAGRLAGAEW
jgi:hypothetical protein